MKLENDRTFATQSPPRKSYNPFDSDDEHRDDFIKSYDDKYNLKRFEKNVAPFSLNLDDHNMSWEEAILGHSSKSAPVMNDEEVLRGKDTELFTDKTVINGAKESFYYTVKDIGVDEGLPKHVSSPQSLNGETDGDADIKNQVSPFIDELKFESKSNVEKDLMTGQHSANPFETDFLTKIDESDLKRQGAGDKLKLGVMSHAARDHEQSCETDEVNFVEVDEKGNGDSKKEHNVDDVPLEHAKESSTKPSIMNTTEAVMMSRETQNEEATTLESTEHPVQQVSTTDKLSYNSKVESGNIVLDSKSSTKSGREEEKTDLQNDGNVKPPKLQTILRHEDGTIGVDKCVRGDTSFSSAMPPPLASVTYMARCGSTSLRSESSTGSTRSFAFPVLQTEWNSSPVRMAKPDPRHGQKYRGWVQSLICCKF